MHILVVEDNQEISATIEDYLGQRGFVVHQAFDGVTALGKALGGDYDAMIVDVMVPKLDGLQFIHALRAAEKTTPVLILSSKGALPDKLGGFEHGADDYMVKPFELAELEARLVAIARRSTQPRLLRVGDLTFDMATLRVERKGAHIKLSPTARSILKVLMRESHRVVSRAELEKEIWGEDLPASDALRTHVAALRLAIDKPFDRPLLHTLHGIGYRLAIENET